MQISNSVLRLNHAQGAGGVKSGTAVSASGHGLCAATPAGGACTQACHVMAHNPANPKT
jgi:hypothetical protein